jgi:hypothetical protein
MARSRNLCYGGNAAMNSVCVVELHVTVNCTVQNNESCTTMLLRQIYVVCKNKTDVGPHGKARCCIETK